jgi:hypothetical protein
MGLATERSHLFVSLLAFYTASSTTSTTNNSKHEVGVSLTKEIDDGDRGMINHRRLKFPSLVIEF